ncbi:glycine betaine ABC transporter substrate-binding protein [Paenibacillus sediminis]|uniref:Osmoprotectant transport system substrate-binding protein n=1 Tax=Paenibacillus sediminis TaxID=664909 RepID=A0ABS4H2T0_9BACL|nr:glycine betaine ABC transporter substrate-binding protein [Paenibacillus sediminis]MBP1936828.1 osmoprotectant transport system substrate-binding protein [Paenibacillus sediminis]
MKKWIAMTLAAVLFVLLTGCGSSKEGSKGTITIGSKNFTENIILAHMMADVIEHDTDLKVVRKVNLGGSNVAWKALLNNDIQMYPDYTGTITSNYYQEKTGTSEETLNKTKELLKRDKLEFVNKFGFNNTYTLAVSKETADKYQLKTFSDLVKVSKDLSLGCEFEFKDRPDGYLGLQKDYGMNFKDVIGMDHGIMYRSLTDKKVDVIDAFSTDGQIKINNLVILKDDKASFPPYDAGSLVREDVLTKYPEIKTALQKLEGVITEADMQELNAKVDSEGLKEETVAHDFLKEKGLLD